MRSLLRITAFIVSPVLSATAGAVAVYHTESLFPMQLLMFATGVLLLSAAGASFLVVDLVRAHRRADSANRELQFQAEQLKHAQRGLARQANELQRQRGSLLQVDGSVQRASPARSNDFLARVSHEIRTPMNGVIGMLELLRTARLTDEEREHLDLARESADSLLTLLNDILDFSKIEAGRFELETLCFDFREVFSSALRTLGVHAQEKRLAFSVRISPVVPQFVIGDPARLRQVMVNLVGNAIKFTEDGGIAVTVACHSLNEREVWLDVSVADTGIGVSQEQQSRIFDAFGQAERSTSRRFGGTGLGLAITNQLVEMMGGRIRVESQPGQGSTFSFVARFAAASSDTPVPAIPRCDEDDRNPILGETQSANILLAEDGLVNQKVAVRLLERRGHRITVAENGREAIRMLGREAFDLILMDVEMPDLDGVQATRAIRERERISGGHIAIVAMTAHAIKGDRERFLAAGMDDYLAKPFRVGELYEIVERVAAGNSAHPPKRIDGAAVKTANCIPDSFSAPHQAD